MKKLLISLTKGQELLPWLFTYSLLQIASLKSRLMYIKLAADKVTIDSTTTVDAVTKKVNGKAKKGLKDRKERFQKAKDSINCL
jgi:hypothetical protein